MIIILADILHKIAAMDYKEYDFRPRPSLAGPERCIRQMVMWGLKIPRSPMPGRAVMVFDDSTWHAELILDWLRKSAFQIHSQEMPVLCRPPMGRGLIDGIITDIEKVDRLLEIKAISHFSFQRLWDGPLPLDNLTQVAIYLDAIKEENPQIDEAILLIKSKNTATFLEYRLHYKWDVMTVIEMINSQGERKSDPTFIPNIYQDAIDKFNLVHDYIAQKRLPKRQYEMNDWRCQYCSWHGPCWENYQEEFKELKTDYIMPEEFGTAIRFYQELGGQISDMQKQRDQVRARIITNMKEADAREGRAEEYIVRLRLEQHSEYTVSAKTIEKFWVQKIKGNST